MRLCFLLFLAPTGAQGVTMSICVYVCLSGSSLSRALNLHLSNSDLKAALSRSQAVSSHLIAIQLKKEEDEGSLEMKFCA